MPRISYSIAHFTRAHSYCQELALQHPSWPQSRVRAAVARELNISTVQLRYLLAKAPPADVSTAPSEPAAK